MSAFWLSLFVPLVNLGTAALKQAAPKIPPAVLPVVNLATGLAIALLARHFGIDPGGALSSDPTGGAIVGTAIAGAATMAHGVAKNVKE